MIVAASSPSHFRSNRLRPSAVLVVPCLLVALGAFAAGVAGRSSGSLQAAAAEPATTAAESPRADVAPGDVELFPADFELIGLRSRRQLIVTQHRAGGRTIDRTSAARYETSDPAVVEVDAQGVATPRRDGEAEIRATFDGRTATTRVVVRGTVDPSPVDFRTEVIAAISRAGCNQGACHGSPQGKDGFRLSLRGFDPDLDLVTLGRESDGRRVNRFDPPQSLVLLKGAGRIPHQGGVRFRSQDRAYQTLKEWIAEGCLDSLRPRRLVGLDVFPPLRSLETGHPVQQLAAIARFDDGTVRDVTHEAVFSAATPGTVEVSADGRVEFARTAEATVLVRYLDFVRSSQLSYVDLDAGYAFQGPEPVGEIDRQVFAKQRALQLAPAPLADDATFLRRVHLDLIGTLPTEAEARAFLDSTEPDKRERLIDRLLEREEFAYFWAMKWADVMRGNRTTISSRGVHSLHRYLVDHFAADRPFTQLARELLTGAGNTLHRPAATFHRISPTPDEAAESFSQLFLGVRIQCAKCHNHPFESITQTDYYSLAAYFARVKIKGKQFALDDEIVYLDRQGEVQHPLTRKNLEPAAFGSPAGKLEPDDDRRERLVDWLTASDNRYFARSTVNRIWFHLLGRGIVDPVDDFRDTNPPSHPELLDALARDFAAGGYRLKPIVRQIARSRTYQLAAAPSLKQSDKASAAERYFTRATVRMMTAEQAVDAVSAALGLPERFPGYPAGVRAIELPEGAIDNFFLMSFSRPVRDSACDCAREEEPTLGEALHLLNNPGLIRRLESPESRLGRWLAAGRPTSDIVESLYLTTLSRRPGEAERQLAERHVSEVGDRGQALRDLLHAMLNTQEFLLRH